MVFALRALSSLAMLLVTVNVGHTAGRDDLLDFRSPASRRLPAAEPASIGGDVRLRTADGGVAASVDVWAEDPATGMEVARDHSDRDGRFRLRVGAGRYVVWASRPGILRSAYGAARFGLPGQPLVIEAGQSREIRLIVDRAPAVTGVVRDEQGSPIPDATVAIVRPPTARFPLSQVVSRATSDASGVYRADDLVPGEYVAVAMPRFPADAYGGLAPQFFPGVDHQSRALRIVLDVDQERSGVDFVLPRRRVTRLSGTVTSAADVHLQDIVVVVTGIDDSPPTWEAPAVLEGLRFELALHRGRYRIDIRAAGVHSGRSRPDGGWYYASSTVEISNDSPVEFQFVVQEGVEVRGQVRSPGVQTNGLGVRLVPVLGRQAASRPVEATVGVDGRFRLEGVAPGRYDVELLGAAGSCLLDGLLLRGEAQATAVVDIHSSASESEPQLELVVRPSTASLSGTFVTTHTGVTSTVVGLLFMDRNSLAGRPSPLVLTRADTTGTYVFSKRVPGTYTLFLLRESDVTSVESATLVEDLWNGASAGIPVTLVAGVETNLNIRIAGGK